VYLIFHRAATYPLTSFANMMQPSVTGFSTPRKIDVTRNPFNTNKSIFAVDQPNLIAIAEATNESTISSRQQIEPIDIFAKFPYLFVPFLDRVSLNRLFSSNKEIYAASQEVREAVTLLWPEKKLWVGSRVFSVAFSPDGGLLACGCESEKIHLWNRSNGRGTLLEGHTSWVRSVSFSADGKFLASGSWDRTIRLWKIDDHSCRVLEGHDNVIYSIAFSPDGATLASGAYDGDIRLWDVSDGKCKKTLRDPRIKNVFSVAWSPDGAKLAAAGHGGEIHLWGISNEEDTSSSPTRLHGHKGYVHSLAFSPDGRYLASASADKSVKLWNADDLICESVLEGHMKVVNSVCFSPNGNILASRSSDRNVQLWKVKQTNGGLRSASSSHHGSHVMSVSFSSDGRTLASGGFHGFVRLCDVSC
jgi:WD40 repeat protein